MSSFTIVQTLRSTHAGRAFVGALTALCLLAAPARAQGPSPLERVEALDLDSLTVERVTAYFAPGDRERATQLAALCEDAMEFFERRLGVSFDLRLTALGPDRWFSEHPGVPYAIPWVSVNERLLVLPSSLSEGVMVAGRRERDGRRLVDFVTLHELGHVVAKQFYHPRSARNDLPVQWFDELLATYFAYAFADAVDPAWAEWLRNEWRASVEGYTPSKLSLDWSFMRSMPGEELARTYGWYQMMLNLRVAALHDEYGLTFLKKIEQGLPWADEDDWTTATLLPLLDGIAPGFRAWAADLGRVAEGRSPSPRPLALAHVTVVDVRDGARQPDRTVVIRGDRIAAVGRSGDVEIPDDARMVDAAGRFLIPGLWDMHVHSAAAADRVLPLYIALGVTGVRNMHSTVDTALELTESIKRRLAAGTLLGPRFIANGPVVDGPVPVHPGSVALGTPDAARAAVDSLAAGGADFIKVYERLPRDVYFAIVDEAKRIGIPFVGHVPTVVRVEEAADAGQRSIEHDDALRFACSPVGDSIRATFETSPPHSYEEFVGRTATLARTFDVDRCAPAIAALRRNGTWFTPTHVIYWAAAHPDSVLGDATALAVMPPEVRQTWKADSRDAPKWRRDADAAIRDAGTRTVRALHRAGVPLLAGTDVGNPLLVPGYSLHKELELLVADGLTPLEALRAATLEPARFLEATDSLGTIEPGKIADLVLLDADPLDDIRNTRRIRAVVANGRYFDRAALDGLLARAVEAANVAAGSR